MYIYYLMPTCELLLDAVKHVPLGSSSYIFYYNFSFSFYFFFYFLLCDTCCVSVVSAELREASKRKRIFETLKLYLTLF